MCRPGGGSKDRVPLQKPAQPGFPAKEFDTLFRLLRRPTNTNACHQPRVPPFPALESSQAAIVCTEITRLINFSLLGPQHGISREKIPSPCQGSKPSGPKSQTPGLSSGAPGLHQFGILHGRQRGPPSARSMHTFSSARFPGGQCPICSGPKKKKDCGLTPKTPFAMSVFCFCVANASTCLSVDITPLQQVGIWRGDSWCPGSTRTRTRMQPSTRRKEQLDPQRIGFPFVLLPGRKVRSKGRPYGKQDRSHCSRGTFPILSRDPSFQKASRIPGKTDPGLEKNDG